MKICENGILRDMTPTEIAEMEEENKRAEREYWQNVDYATAVNTEIRKLYTDSEEFAILRQKDEKPEEYAKYYADCEQCKAYIKQKKGLV